MDINECYRLLELETGASREAVDDAHRRLIERWSPDRVAAGDPEAVREAQRRVQAINDAHRALVQAAASAQPSAPPTTSSAPTAGAKPTLRPLFDGQTPPSAPRPPSSETWSARPAPAAGAPLPPPESAAPPPAASAPPPVPKSNRVASAPKPAAARSAAVAGPRGSKAAFYETLFPAGSPRRRFAPFILAAALILVLLLGMWAFSSSGRQSTSSARAPAPAAPDPQTVGQLHVKSNRADATVEATRTPSGGEAQSASVNGTVGQTLSGLLPGKYIITARTDGWPDVRAEATVEIGRTTEVAVNFKSGSLRLDTEPSGATVRLGGTVLGKTPLLIPDLPPGESKLSLEYPFWPAVTAKATITADVESAATVRLPHGKLTVESSPSGAEVLMGGRSVGQTPLVLEKVPAGPKKLTLQAKDFPPLELSVTVEDRGEAKVSPSLGSAFPVLDPELLLRSVWVPDDPDKLAPPHDGMAGPSAPRNDIVKNLNRKRLFEGWLRKWYGFSAVVKSYDQGSGQVEFAEQKSELARYRVLAKLGPEAFKDKELAARMTKGATVALYGRLTAVEEPRWPFKVITLELSAAEPLR